MVSQTYGLTHHRLTCLRCSAAPTANAAVHVDIFILNTLQYNMLQLGNYKSPLHIIGSSAEVELFEPVYSLREKTSRVSRRPQIKCDSTYLGIRDIPLFFHN